jgi:hypothetical protein
MAIDINDFAKIMLEILEELEDRNANLTKVEKFKDYLAKNGLVTRENLKDYAIRNETKIDGSYKNKNTHYESGVSTSLGV